MPKYNTKFELDINDLQAIEDALREKLHSSTDKAECQRVIRLLAHLHHQKNWYRPGKNLTFLVDITKALCYSIRVSKGDTQMAQVFDRISLEDLVIDQHSSVKLLDGYAIFYGRGKDALFGETSGWSDEGIELFQAFCAEKGITYYGAPREDFFMFEAWEKAEREGNTYLLAEDLS